MKIVIAGGNHEAEYIIHSFHKRENELVVINSEEEIAEKLIEREHVPVYVGDPTKMSTLENTKCHDADVFISLCEKDVDNYAACFLAKKNFDVKKCICVVKNPNNVDLFKRLGIDSVISSAYLLGDSIRSESSVENIIKAIKLENNQVMMVEFVVNSNHEIAEKAIADIAFPKFASICCILRGSEVIIPNGQVKVEPKDKMLIACAPKDQKPLVNYLRQEKSKAEIELEKESFEKANSTYSELEQK